MRQLLEQKNIFINMNMIILVIIIKAKTIVVITVFCKQNEYRLLVLQKMDIPLKDTLQAQMVNENNM